MARVTYETALVEEKAVAHVQAMALRLLRAKRMSRTDLARAMGVSVAHVSQLFADEPKNLSVKKAARMFHHLGEQLVMTCKGIELLDEEAAERNAQREILTAKKGDTFAWFECANGNDQEPLSVRPLEAA